MSRLEVFCQEWAPLLVFRLRLCSLLGGGDRLRPDTKREIRAEGILLDLLHLCFPGRFLLLVHLLQLQVERFQRAGYYSEKKHRFIYFFLSCLAFNIINHNNGLSCKKKPQCNCLIKAQGVFSTCLDSDSEASSAPEDFSDSVS